MGRLDATFSRTPTGGLRVPASLTRTGVLTYRNQDGTTRREYRPADEVFKADSLQSLEDAPVTDLHPAKMVDGANHRELSRGHVRDGRKDGKFVAATVLVQDADLVAKVERRDRVEVSCGYRCRFDATPGVTPEGERYDGVQRDIVYNHVALLPAGTGRAGREVALRLDAAYEDMASAAFSVGDKVVALVDHMPGMKGKSGTVAIVREGAPPYYGVKFDGMSDVHKWLAQDEISAAKRDAADEEPMKIIRIDGKDYEIGSDAHIAKLTEDAGKALTAATARADKAEGELKVSNEKLVKVEADLKVANERADAAEKPVKEAARKDLEAKAAKVLGPEYKFDGKKDEEIRADVAKKALDGEARSDSAGGEARVAAVLSQVSNTGGNTSAVPKVAKQPWERPLSQSNEAR